jgi:hypothetical protein
MALALAALVANPAAFAATGSAMVGPQAAMIDHEAMAHMDEPDSQPPGTCDHGDLACKVHCAAIQLGSAPAMDTAAPIAPLFVSGPASPLAGQHEPPDPYPPRALLS